MLLALIIGSAGFALLFLYDYAQIRNLNRIASSCLSMPGYAGIAFAYIFLLFQAPRPAVAPAAAWMLAGGAVIMFLLLVYSVLIEIPINTAHGRGGSREVYQSGTYRLVRHPGFLWFTFMSVLLMVLYLDAGFTMVCSLFVGMNFFLVLAEDAVFFPRIFVDYAAYKQRVPFLVPIRTSRRSTMIK